MKVIDCPCGETLEAEDEDGIVAEVEEHVADKHPDMAGKYDREQILSMARDG
jgi:hypothetical protein